MHVDMTHTSAHALERLARLKLKPWGLSTVRKGPRSVTVTQRARVARSSLPGLGSIAFKDSRVSTVGGPDAPVEAVLFQRIKRAEWDLGVAEALIRERRNAEEKRIDDDGDALLKDRAIRRALDESSPEQLDRFMRLCAVAGLRG
jgi:hypothetical protein